MASRRPRNAKPEPGSGGSASAPVRVVHSGGVYQIPGDIPILVRQGGVERVIAARDVTADMLVVTDLGAVAAQNPAVRRTGDARPGSGLPGSGSGAVAGGEDRAPHETRETRGGEDRAPHETGATSPPVGQGGQTPAETTTTPGGGTAPATTTGAAAAGDVADEGPGPDASDEEVDTYLRENHGYLSWTLEHPELAPIVRQAMREGRDEAWIEGRLRSTEWWQTTAPQRREWTVIQHEDPARASQMVANVAQDVMLEAARLGAHLSGDRARRIAQDALANGWVSLDSLARQGAWLTRAIVAEAAYNPTDVPTSAEVVQLDDGAYLLVTRGDQRTLHRATGRGQLAGIVSLYGRPQRRDAGELAGVARGADVVELFGGPGAIEEVVAGTRSNPLAPAAGGGDIGAMVDAVVAASREWMVPLSEDAAWNWARRMLLGEATEQGLEAYLRDLARGRFPAIDAHLQAGMTPTEFFNPYVQEIARLLEVNPNDVNLLEDPRFSRIVEFVPPGAKEGNVLSERRPMTMSEMQQYVRGLPEWNGTRQALSGAGALAESLLENFGAIR